MIIYLCSIDIVHGVSIAAAPGPLNSCHWILPKEGGLQRHILVIIFWLKLERIYKGADGTFTDLTRWVCCWGRCSSESSAAAAAGVGEEG